MAEAYVYITLPGSTEAVAAGRFEHSVDRNGIAVGRFVYGRRYREREDAVEIDPVELRLGRAAYETVRLNGVFGALRDATPDDWGRRVIEKRSGNMEALVARQWYAVARGCGVSEAECAAICRAYNYPGFRAR